MSRQAASRPNVRRFVPQRVIEAAEAFVSIEAASGIVLMLTAVVAIVWANSPWDNAYFDLWHKRIAIETEIFSIDQDLRHWLNDGLMTAFFFLMGLEIKRELVHGEMSSPRRALLPAVAALGGMAAPALIYTALNAGGEGANGWGIPMATDTAFALGVLLLLGSRVPFSMKIFLVALAIADDIGALTVIAVFYTADVDYEALAIAAATLAVIVTMNRGGVRNVNVYVVAGIVLWIATFESGVHATVAGVILGLLTPASPFYAPSDFASTADDLVESYRGALDSGDEDAQEALLGQVEDLSQGTEAPLDRLERALHPWVSYAVVPLFALANAGVALSGDAISDAVDSSVTQGVFLALFLGKPAGIFIATWVSVRCGLCQLPSGANLRHVLGIGLIAGIGFTVSLLVNGLAFTENGAFDQAKLGVLGASICAGAVGFAFLWLTGRRQAEEEAA
ncbi:MAG TPA: Na+/H+ antiporter NhaA [Dehalococcoidia bacterium]|nr:Na+/H+ antiporter NhaA [Dehalococcoidia bacterium]